MDQEKIMQFVSGPIGNLVLVFGLMKLGDLYKLDAPENALYIRLGYGLCQVVILAALAITWQRINQKKDQTALVYVKQNNPLDAKDVETIKTTVYEYDKEQALAFFKQTAMSVAIVVAMHYYWGYLRPLFLQSILGYKPIFTTQIFRIHLLGQPATGDLVRPWKQANPFGLDAPTNDTSAKELKQREKKEAKKKINRID
ncbi:inorganic phosphate transporter Pho88 [Polychytrium aggregatum]|uniref:inorganic phosphate transporter Pho88 n=1 Tax=Polychytrium aggregatum TaxID=110093 RepID=UPI0022FE64FF|nr:inorganic phosphate transporter Pho88 [Polychytrium aggregatum]KAI9199846.1 inorganic phosphate transporter Pho88 [Polychytrium aggregatum]